MRTSPWLNQDVMEGSGSRVPKIAGIIQLVICAFLVVQYLEDREHLTLTVLMGSPFAITAIGMLMGQRWAVPAAVAVNTLVVLLLWGTAIERRTSNVVLGAVAFSVPWLLLFPYWLHDRRQRRRTGHIDQPPALEPKTKSEEAPAGWTKEWGGGRVKFWSMLLIGLLCLAAGIGILSDGEITVGVTVLGFGVAIVAGAPMFRTWDRDGHISVAPVEGRAEKGLVFPYSRSKTVAATLASAGMAVACGGISLGAFQEHEGPTPTWLVAFGIVGFIFFGWIALVSLRRNGVRAGFVALTTSGIAARLPAMQCFVPWDAIEDVRTVEMSFHHRGTTTHEPFIGLVISNLDRVEMSSVGRLFAGFDVRFLGTDINLPVRTMDVDPRLLLESIEHYWRTPAARADVGTTRIPTLN